MAQRLKEKLSGLSFRYMLTVGSILFVLIIAVVFFGYTARENLSQYKEETGQRTEFLSKQMVDLVDDRLRIFEKYYIASMDEEEVDHVLQNDFTYSDYSVYKPVMDILSTKKMFIDYVDSYTLILYRTGWVISSKGLMTLNDLSNKVELSEFYRKSRTVGLRHFWNYNKKNEIETTTAVNVDERTTVDTSELTLIMRLPFDSINTNALAVVKINMNTLKSWIDEMLEENETVVIVDDNGNIVYSPDDRFDEIAIQLFNEEFDGYKKIEGKEIKDWMAAEAVSSANGWHYFTFTSLEGNGVFGTRGYKSWIGPVILLLVVMAMIITLTYFIYKPVDGLVKEVSKTANGISGNEFELISSHLSNLLDDRSVLEKMVAGQESKIREMFERRLINEGIKSEDEWDDYFKGLGLPNYPCFATGVLVLDLRLYPDPQNTINEDAICLQIIDSMPENINKLLWMPAIYNSCAIVVFFGAENEDLLLEKIVKFHEEIQKFTYEHTGYHMLEGISSTCHDHKHFRRAYRESVKALTKQGYEDFSPNTESIKAEDMPDLRFYTASKPSIKGESYSNDFENDVRIAIKEVDKHKAYQLTDRFAEHLATVTQSDVSVLYIMRYVNSIVLTGMEAGIAPDEAFTEGIRQAYAELMSEIEPRKVRKKIKKFFIDPIIDLLSEKMQNDSYNVMEAIDRLMDKTKGNILLSECADELGVHQTYIWKILKMEKGKSFTEYAEKYKIEEAKKLLLQTNMSVQEIAASLDYANAQNFIRFFSKVTGVTPGKFRKLY